MLLLISLCCAAVLIIYKLFHKYLKITFQIDARQIKPISNESNSCKKQNKTAIVIGSSVSGLMTAAVLSRHFSKVIICEQNKIHCNKSLVPQAYVYYYKLSQLLKSNHGHILLSRGIQIIEALFPKFFKSLKGTKKLMFSDHIVLKGMTRTYFEVELRNRVMALQNVEIRDDCKVIDFDIKSNTVTGIKLETYTQLNCSLLVDCSGATCVSRKILKNHGIDISVKRFACNVTYSSLKVQSNSDIDMSYQIIYKACRFPQYHGVLTFEVENDQHIITCIGLGNVCCSQTRIM